MARRKGVAAPKVKKPSQKESWRLENLRLRLKKHDTSEDVVLYGVAREAIDYIEELERSALAMQRLLDDANKTIEDKDVSNSSRSLIFVEVSDAARRVIELVPVVLGREDVVSESIEAFDLRRAVEDLETAC